MLVAIGLIALVGIGVWYYGAPPRDPARDLKPAPVEVAWLYQLYSQNPTEAAAAADYVRKLGPGALPVIHATLQDPAASTERTKAALKACALLGPAAASAVTEVARFLPEPALTSEAAAALSFMGRDALTPLQQAVGSSDPLLRKEALRSIGKLKERAALNGHIVVPLLVSGMQDADAGVRAVAATYLGIVHDEPSASVPVLTGGLEDPDADVRRSAAAALAAFGADAAPALPALRKASGDADPEVAREAGVTLVKLQPTK